jgi:hypothetical protein
MGSDLHVWVGDGLQEIRSSTALELTADGDLRRTIYHTPHGDLEQISRFDRASQADHPQVFPIREREHLLWLSEWYADAWYEVDEQAMAEIRARCREIGEDAVIAAAMGTSPLMHFVELLAGVENAHLLLADYPEETAILFDAMHGALRRRVELMTEHHPADLLYLVENTSTTLISPAQYRTLNMEHLREYAETAQAAGRLLALHMCGHLRALLPDLAQLPVNAFEAFTSPTVGNTTLLDGRQACPDVCLIGGTNAALWLRPATEIIAQLDQDLAALPHHRGLVLTSAGVMPPACRPETIREVCRWVQKYPVVE